MTVYRIYCNVKRILSANIITGDQRRPITYTHADTFVDQVMVLREHLCPCSFFKNEKTCLAPPCDLLFVAFLPSSPFLAASGLTRNLLLWWRDSSTKNHQRQQSSWYTMTKLSPFFFLLSSTYGWLQQRPFLSIYQQRVACISSRLFAEESVDTEENPCWQDIYDEDCSMDNAYAASFVASEWLKKMPCAEGIEVRDSSWKDCS